MEKPGSSDSLKQNKTITQKKNGTQIHPPILSRPWIWEKPAVRYRVFISSRAQVTRFVGFDNCAGRNTSPPPMMFFVLSMASSHTWTSVEASRKGQRRRGGGKGGGSGGGGVFAWVRRRAVRRWSLPEHHADTSHFRQIDTWPQTARSASWGSPILIRYLCCLVFCPASKYHCDDIR